MSDLRALHGMTIAINAGDFIAVLDFYTRVFGRGPDTAPMDNFLEWQICPGAWLQLSCGHSRPGANNARVRFEVHDIAAAVARMADAKVPIGEVVTVPDVVAFANFSDNWGNALGFYELLSPRRMTTADERREQEADQQARRDAEEAAAADAAAPTESPEEAAVRALLPETGAGVPHQRPAGDGRPTRP